MVGEKICRRYKKQLASNWHPSDFGEIVAAACIAHDIGNPPFGHSGEDAIRHWFQTSRIACEVRDKLSKDEILDIDKYEGNAQGFRLIARLQWPDNRGGLRLTCATLGAFTKYPVTSPISKAYKEAGKKIAGTKKFGFFLADRDLFREVAEQVGLIPLPDHPDGWARHPLVFLVEAADDICYRLIDFEDGFRLGLVPYEQIQTLFLSLIGEAWVEKKLKQINSKKDQIEFLRSVAIGRVIQQVAAAFLREEKAIRKGDAVKPLIELIPAATVLHQIEEISIRDVYTEDRVVEIEAAGFEVLGGLLDIFTEATIILPDSLRSQKMQELLPNQFRPGAKDSPYEKLLQLLDFVSGMTDSYAVSLYKKLKGISLPGQ